MKKFNFVTILHEMKEIMSWDSPRLKSPMIDSNISKEFQLEYFGLLLHEEEISEIKNFLEQ